MVRLKSNHLHDTFFYSSDESTNASKDPLKHYDTFIKCGYNAVLVAIIRHKCIYGCKKANLCS